MREEYQKQLEAQKAKITKEEQNKIWKSRMKNLTKSKNE